VFTTKLTGPRINTCFVTQSHGLFLTCRGEKYEKRKNIFTMYTVQQSISIWVAIKVKIKKGAQSGW
jgi:hypothetical protein